MHRDILEKEKIDIEEKEIQQMDEIFVQEFELFEEEYEPDLMRLFDLELKMNKILSKHEIKKLPLPNFTESLIYHLSVYVSESESPSEYYKTSLFELAKGVILKPEQRERIFLAFSDSKVEPSFQDKIHLTEIAGEDLGYLAEKYFPRTNFEIVENLQNF